MPGKSQQRKAPSPKSPMSNPKSPSYHYYKRSNDNMNKVSRFNYQHSFPNKVHVQMSQISNGVLPCITSKHIQSFDLNPMTKEIFLVTDTELAIFDIERNQFKAVRTFKQITSYQIASNPTLQSIGETKLPEQMRKQNLMNLNKSETQNDIKSQQAQPSQGQQFVLPVSLNLYNYWTIIKSNKQVLFLDSNLNFSKETVSDSNGIMDMVVNQKSEEILTVTKDLRQIRIWTYMIYTKDRPMPPIDELPVNVNYVDSNLHVFVTNKKNIHLNLSIEQMCLNHVCDLLICSSLESNEITIFTTKEGKNLYSLEYQRVRPSEMIDQLTPPKVFQGILVKNKHSHDHGYFSKIPEGYPRALYQIKTHQEFVFVMNRRTSELIVWDLGLEKTLYSVGLNLICQCPQNNIDFFYPNLSNFKAGFIVIDDMYRIYDVSLKSLTVLQKYDHMKTIQMNQADKLDVDTFTSEAKKNLIDQSIRRSSVLNPSAELRKQQAMEEVRSGFTPERKNRSQIKSPKREREDYGEPIIQIVSPKSKQINQAIQNPYYQLRYMANLDGTKTIFLIKQDSLQVDIINFHSNVDFGVELKTQTKHLDKPLSQEVFQFSQGQKQYKNLLPIIDQNNQIQLYDICWEKFNSNPRHLFQASFNDMLISQDKMMIDLVTLEDKHKQRRDTFHQSPKHFKYHFQSRVAVFIEPTGLACIVNTHYRTRKYIYLEDRLKIKDIHIMVNQDQTNPFFNQLKEKTLTDEEFTRKDNPYRFLDDYPDFDFLVAFITTDGLILVVSNETQFNDIRLSHKINVQAGVLHSKYLEDKQKLAVIMREGYMKIFDASKTDFPIIKQSRLMWGDITAIDMRSDEILIAGHESGIIYTQSIKGEVKVTEMQIHNYHLVPIIQICLPCFKSGVDRKGKFIALAQNMVLTLFSMDADRPIKVMSFAAGSFNRVIYVGKNEILAFDGGSKYIMKIDLHDATVFSEQNRKGKEEWINVIQQRIIRNQFNKKPVQVEEQKNEQFYEFQAFKQKIYSQKGDFFEPILYKFYMNLHPTKQFNLFNSAIQLEYAYVSNQFLLSGKDLMPSKQFYQIRNPIFMNAEIKAVMEALSLTCQEIDFTPEYTLPTSQSQQSLSITNQKQNKKAKAKGGQLPLQNFLDSIEFNRKMRGIQKLNKGYKQSVIHTQLAQSQSRSNLQNSVFKQQNQSQTQSVQNLQSQKKDEFQEDYYLLGGTGTFDQMKSQKSLQDLIESKKQLPVGQNNQVIMEEVREEDQEKSFKFNMKIDRPKTQFTQFLQGMQPKPITASLIASSEDKMLAQPIHHRNVSGFSGISSFYASQQPPEKQRNIDTPQILAGRGGKQRQYQLPQISVEEYQQELMNMRKKIQKIEERAQTAADQRMKLNTKLSGVGQTLGYMFNSQYKSPTSSQGERKDSISSKVFSQDTKQQNRNQSQTITKCQSEVDLKSNVTTSQQNRKLQKVQSSQLDVASSTYLMLQQPSQRESIVQSSEVKNRVTTPQTQNYKRQYLNEQVSLVEQKRPQVDYYKKTQESINSKLNQYQVPSVDYFKPYYTTSKPFTPNLDNQMNRSQERRLQIEVEGLDTEVNSNNNLIDIQDQRQPILQKKVLHPTEFQFNIKGKQKPQSAVQTPTKSKSPQRETIFSDKDYGQTLKRLLFSDKGQEQKRINIMEKKPELIVQERKPVQVQSDEDKKEEGDSSDDKSSQSSQDDENKLLNEEERSLIVEEILRAQGDLVFEDQEDDLLPLPTESQPGQHSISQSSREGSKEGGGKKLKIIVKNEKAKPDAKKTQTESQKIKQLNLLANKYSKDKTAFELGFLSAHKMKIVKHSKKEKNGSKYQLMKELMRDKVQIQKQDQGFQIILPKSLQYGKPNLKNIEIDDFISNYNVFRLNYKDIVNMIREQLSLESDKDADQIMITKDQVALFLKKNLSKLLVQEDPAKLRKDKKIQEQLQKIETVKMKRLAREQEKIIKQLQKEEQMQVKREKAQLDKLKEEDLKKAKQAIIDQKKQDQKKYQQQFFKLSDNYNGGQSRNSTERQHHDAKPRNSFTMDRYQGLNGPPGLGDLNMVFATELKIEQRREDIRKKLELMRIEKDQERLRNEKYQMMNFIRDVIVKGLLINRKVGAYIRMKDQGMIDFEKYLRGFNSDEEREPMHRQSLLPSQSNQSASFSNERIQKSMNPPSSRKGRRNLDKKASEIGISLLDGDNQPVQKIGVKIVKKTQKGKQIQKRKESIEKLGLDTQHEIVVEENSAAEGSRRPSRGGQSNEDMLGGQSVNRLQIQTQARGSRNTSYSGRKGSTRLANLNVPQTANAAQKLTPQVGKNDRVKKRSSNKLDSDESLVANDEIIKDSVYSRAGLRNGKSPSHRMSREDSQDDYYEEGKDGDAMHELGVSLGKPGTTGQQLGSRMKKRVNRLKLIRDNSKIIDYNLENQSNSSQDPMTGLNSITGAGQGSQFGFGQVAQGDIYSVLDSDMAEDEMTKEEEIARINIELQYQRILEKITEKMMSKKISSFKKELLIRIALIMESMKEEDLGTLEDLLERFESNDPQVKELIIELFQEKYQIDLGTDLQVLIEEQMNKVKDDAKTTKKRNIKELLLKKIRMLNLIGRLFKPGQSVDPFQAALKAQSRLKDLLDDDDYNSDDEDNFSKEFQETVREILKRIFTPEDNVMNKQLLHFKSNFKAKFSAQPEYLVNDDGEANEKVNKELMAKMRLRSFTFNEARLLEVLQLWLHPEAIVIEGLIGDSLVSKAARRRKQLYSKDSEFNEDNMFECFYDLVQEMMRRMKKVQRNIKNNDLELRTRDKFKDTEGDSSSVDVNSDGSEGYEISENGSIRKKTKKQKRTEVIDLQELEKRRQMGDQELMERQYCALRIAEYLETNMLSTQYLKGEDEKEEIRVENFLNQGVGEMRANNIEHYRRKGLKDPMMTAMAKAFRTYAQLMQ